LRAGLLAFVDAIPPEHELLLVSTGRRTEIRVPPTADRKKVQGSIQGLLAGDGPTPLMDALLETDERMMRKATDRSLVFVLVTGDGSESSKSTDGETFNRWLATLAKRNVIAHAIVLKKGNGLPEVIAHAMTGNTGGHFETVGTGPQLAAKLQSLGAQIAADYNLGHR
jgi:Mg-chelatase subunit ChlD